MFNNVSNGSRLIRAFFRSKVSLTFFDCVTPTSTNSTNTTLGEYFEESYSDYDLEEDVDYDYDSYDYTE